MSSPPEPKRILLVSEKLSGNGFLSRFTTNDIIRFIGFLGMAVWLYFNISHRVDDHETDISELKLNFGLMQKDVVSMNQKGTYGGMAAIEQYGRSAEQNHARLTTLESRYVEIISKLARLEATIEEALRISRRSGPPESNQP